MFATVILFFCKKSSSQQKTCMESKAFQTFQNETLTMKTDILSKDLTMDKITRFNVLISLLFIGDSVVKA
jgi:hypothetical protein